MTHPAFPGLRAGSYGAILADPPWSFKAYTAETTPHRSPDEPYDVMALADLATLPVRELAAADCVLFLWTIGTHLDQSIKLGETWGFKYKTKAFEWFKTTKDGLGTKMGMGFWTRQETESVLLFTRGKPNRRDKGVRSAIFASVREHSRKPDELYDRIERLVAGPYCELFARHYRVGWEGWGDEYL